MFLEFFLLATGAAFRSSFPHIFYHLSGLKARCVALVGTRYVTLVSIMKEQVCYTCSHHEGPGVLYLLGPIVLHLEPS